MGRQNRGRISSPRIPSRLGHRPRFSLVEMLEARMMLSSYLVTSNADSGAGSLRQAILDANANPGADTISFALPSDSLTIQPTSALPAVQDQVTIDGATLPGYAGTPLVQIDGVFAGTSVNGLELDAAGCVVRGLVISRFDGDGIVLAGGGATVQGNYVGTDAAGAAAMGNLQGIEVTSGGNLIGGTAVGAGNLISGNKGDGVVFDNIPAASPDPSAINDVLEGNIIGMAATGLHLLSNGGNGVDIGTRFDLSANGIQVGGTDSGAGNLISGNIGNGVLVSASSCVVIEGNRIGLDANGVAVGDFDFLANPLPDDTGNAGNGVQIQHGSQFVTVGGATAAAMNLISGNGGNGVNVSADPGTSAVIVGNSIGPDATNSATSGNVGDGVFAGEPSQISGNVIAANFGAGVELNSGSTVFGNSIGVLSDGTPLGNQGNGVQIEGASNQIGGTDAGQANVIANNAGDGVVVVFGAGNAIRGNSVFSNALLGIDLGSDGVTLNDSMGHTGANDFQDFPVLSSVTGTGAAITVQGTLSGGTVGASYTIDIYANSAADPTGYGEGQTFVGSATVTAGADGTVTLSLPFNVTLPAGQMIFSATATDASGNTSEFSQDVVATIVAPAVSVTMLTSSADPSTFGDAVSFTAAVNGSTSAVPTGSVTFMDGAATLGTANLDGSDVAVFLTDALAAGTHNIKAVYNGDATYPGSNASLSQTVNRADTTTAIAASASSSLVGQSLTFTATIVGATGIAVPSGSVSFFDDTTLLGSADVIDGVATFSTSSLGVGSHGISAVYGGDDNFAASQSDSLPITITAPSGTISGKTLSDVTGDGLSADDVALGGVTVQLFVDLNGDGVLDSGDGAPVATMVSDAATGVYAFTNITPGTYFVQEVTPSGYVRTAPAVGTYYTINITAGSQPGESDFDNFHECHNCGTDLAGVYFLINGKKKVTNLRGQVHQGDIVQAVFTVTAGHTDTLSLVSYTAPSSTFVASQASEQQIYDLSSGTFSTGRHSLTVHVPRCYFQVDFICGLAIDRFGPVGSNIFYSAQARLISADNGGTTPPPPQ